MKNNNEKIFDKILDNDISESIISNGDSFFFYNSHNSSFDTNKLGFSNSNPETDNNINTENPYAKLTIETAENMKFSTRENFFSPAINNNNILKTHQLTNRGSNINARDLSKKELDLITRKLQKKNLAKLKIIQESFMEEILRLYTESEKQILKINSKYDNQINLLYYEHEISLINKRENLISSKNKEMKEIEKDLNNKKNIELDKYNEKIKKLKNELFEDIKNEANHIKNDIVKFNHNKYNKSLNKWTNIAEAKNSARIKGNKRK